MSYRYHVSQGCFQCRGIFTNQHQMTTVLLHRLAQLPEVSSLTLATGNQHNIPLTTQPDRIREDYLKNLQEHREALRAGCIASHIDYSLVDTSRPLDGFLSEFFHERETTIGGAAAPRQ